MKIMSTSAFEVWLLSREMLAFLYRFTPRAFKRIRDQVDGLASSASAPSNKAPTATSRGHASAGRNASTTSEKSAPGTATVVVSFLIIGCDYATIPWLRDGHDT